MRRGDMKILNLYAGIGGNRKLWGDEHDITAVEYNPEIAQIYKDNFPNDTVLVEDAHQYLLDHYKEYDFIWSSPPCPTHSRARFWSSKGGMYDVEYPDMSLWQEILFISNFFKGKYVIENVIPYYKPLIIPNAEMSRHLFWCNFIIPKIDAESNYIFGGDDKKRIESMLGLKVPNIKNKTKILRNCVHPEIGQHILNIAQGIITKQNTNQMELEL